MPNMHGGIRNQPRPIIVEGKRPSIWSSGMTISIPIQEAFIENNGAQCVFCTPGMIMATKAFLDRNPDPTEADVKRALAGHVCRFGYQRVFVYFS
jgi:aerobic-type carbon monoxide dehydrogenase small subunit (CoxS/CutS family)